MKIAVIGGGLAGTACAYQFLRAGHEVSIYEASDDLASEASGNILGLYNPRLSAHMTPQAAYYAAAFLSVIDVFEELKNINWKRCGSLHLITDEKREIKFSKCVEYWGWSVDDMRFLNADDASEVVGIDLKYKALYLPNAGSVSPRKLCAEMAQGAEIFLNQGVLDSKAISDIGADIVVLACGRGVTHFEEASYLPLNHIRGQVSVVRSLGALSNLQSNLCYGGYCSPAFAHESGERVHMVGATFQRWLDHSDILVEDDARNVEGLEAVVPGVAQGMEVLDHRASVRVAAKDVFPVVGALNERVYVSTAHGSHGIVSSMMAARILCAQIEGRGEGLLPVETLQALSPKRFC